MDVGSGELVAGGTGVLVAGGAGMSAAGGAGVSGDVGVLVLGEDRDSVDLGASSAHPATMPISMID